VGTEPLSVAVGNFNLKNNGYPDLAVANWDTNTVGVLLGKGDGTFQAQVTYPVGTSPRSVAVADFNGDGYPDLAVANEGSNTVSVLLGNGDGTFQAAVTYPVGTKPVFVAVGKFNLENNGYPDLAVANYEDVPGDVSVLVGNGDGTFKAAVTYEVGTDPFSVAVGDFNGDGYPDLAVANFGSNTVSVLVGNGDGTFKAQATFGVGAEPVSVAVGKFNLENGYPDLVVANYGDATGDVSVLLGNGDGTFKAAVTYDTGDEPYSVAVGDFNGDGNPDLAVANFGAHNVSVLLGNGDGTFQPQAIFGAGINPSSVAMGDFNGDGKTDLAVANFGDAPGDVSILLNTSNPGSAIVTSPSAYSTLTGGSSATFTWSAGSSATAYWLDVGTAEYGNTIYQSGTLSNTVLSLPVSGLPTNGIPVYATLYTIDSNNGTKVHNEYTYTAFNAQAGAAVMASPTGGSTLTGSSVTFTWSAATPPTGVTATYWLDVGTAEYGNTILQSGTLSTTSQTVSGLPTNGSAVYATLYTIFSNGVKVYNEYTYTAFNASSVVPAVMQSPTQGSTLTTNATTFTWNAGTNVSTYWLDVGNVAGGNQYYQSGSIPIQAATVYVPPNGLTVYVTLYSLAGGLKFHNSYTYTAANGGKISSPTPGTTLTGSSVTFTWSAGSASAYQLYFGSTYGGSDLGQSGTLTATTSYAASGLPTNGNPIYVTLLSEISGNWVQTYYSYVEASSSAPSIQLERDRNRGSTSTALPLDSYGSNF